MNGKIGRSLSSWVQGLREEEVREGTRPGALPGNRGGVYRSTYGANKARILEPWGGKSSQKPEEKRERCLRST